MKQIIAVLALSIVLFAGCKTNQHASTDKSLESTKWILVEMMGKPVSTSQEGKNIYLVLNKGENNITGYSGCNGFGGNYELSAGNRIAFSKMIGTMMACEDMETETQFLKLMQTVDNYNVSEGKLQLNKARMVPLLKFEAEKK